MFYSAQSHTEGLLPPVFWGGLLIGVLYGAWGYMISLIVFGEWVYVTLVCGVVWVLLLIWVFGVFPAKVRGLLGLISVVYIPESVWGDDTFCMIHFVVWVSRFEVLP